MNRYVVWTTHIEPEPHDVAEVSRSVKAVAEQDAAIFREICHRSKAWVQDQEQL